MFGFCVWKELKFCDNLLIIWLIIKLIVGNLFVGILLWCCGLKIVFDFDWFDDNDKDRFFKFEWVFLLLFILLDFEFVFFLNMLVIYFRMGLEDVGNFI